MLLHARLKNSAFLTSVFVKHMRTESNVHNAASTRGVVAHEQVGWLVAVALLAALLVAVMQADVLYVHLLLHIIRKRGGTSYLPSIIDYHQPKPPPLICSQHQIVSN